MGYKEALEAAGAEVMAAAFIMEKRFKNGREVLESLDVPVATLAQVLGVSEGRVQVAGL